MNNERILIFPAIIHVGKKYDIRDHEIEGLFLSIVNELSLRGGVDLDRLDFLLYENDLECFSDMEDFTKKNIAEILIYFGVNEDYYKYFMSYLQGSTGVISTIGKFSLDFFHEFKDLLIPEFLIENENFFCILCENAFSEAEIMDFDNYFKNVLYGRDALWDAFCGCQKMSEKFMIDNIDNIDVKGLEFNNKIDPSVKNRIINLKKVRNA